MGLDKAIIAGKEKRKPYRKAKAIDPTCRNHGTCTRCREDRLYQSRKADIMCEQKLKEQERENG